MKYYHLASHPTWVRGLKPLTNSRYFFQHEVAPYVGAWIETYDLAAKKFTNESHPTWVRGLKHQSFSFNFNQSLVAPYVGAWIETFSFPRRNELG